MFKPQFSIRFVLTSMAVLAVLLAAFRYIPEIAILLIVGTLAANLMGAALALFVTHVLKMPTDGSMWCEEISAESQPQQKSKN